MAEAQPPRRRIGSAQLLILTGLAATLAVTVRRVGDPDFWWHLRTGQITVATHSLPSHDLFTWTVPNNSWTDHEYLTQVLYDGLFKAGGFPGVSLFFAAVIFAGFCFVLWRTSSRPFSAPVAAAALVLGSLSALAVWGPRPQMFDFLFIGVELWVLELFLQCRTRRLHWLLPPLVLVWANLHGGFVFAYFFLAIAAVTLGVRWIAMRNPEDRGRLVQLGLVILCCVAAGLLTPYGPALFTYVWKTQFSSVQGDFIREWLSPNFHQLDMRAFQAQLLLALTGFMWGRLRLWDVLLVLGVTLLALQSVRHIAVFVVATTPVLIWQWSGAWERLSGWWRGMPRLVAALDRRSLAALLLTAVTAGTLAFCVHTLRGQTAATAENFPVGASDWLEAHPSVGTHLFNEYSWGGYLAYRFSPDPNRRVFIYGEAELMGDALMSEYASINGLDPDWAQLLDARGVDYIVYPVNQPFDSAVEATGKWHAVYRDLVAVIYVRN